MGQHLPWTIFDEDFADLSFRDFIGWQPVAFHPPRVVQLQEPMEKTLQRATRRHGTCLPGPHIYGIEFVRRFFKLWESCDLKRTGMHQICIHSLLEYNHPTWFKVPFTVRANTPVEQNRSHKTANQPHIFRTFIHWGLCERCLRGVSLGLLTKQPTPADDDALVRQLKVPPVLFCSFRCWGGTVPFLCGMECYQTTLFCHFWRTRRTRACLTPARSQTSGTTSTMISSPTGSGAWIRYRSEVPDWYEQEILSGKRKNIMKMVLIYMHTVYMHIYIYKRIYIYTYKYTYE